MTDARAETVRLALDAISRRDLAALLQLLDPEIELRPLMSVWQRSYRGHDGIEQWWGDVAEIWDSFEVDAGDFRDLGDEALFLRIQWRGVAKGSGNEVEGPLAAIARFAGDRVSLLEIFVDEGRALASVGR
ncbi:MAG: nuclear transport factor 2 family protein [Solirubrobacterales bacterium]